MDNFNPKITDINKMNNKIRNEDDLIKALLFHLGFELTDDGYLAKPRNSTNEEAVTVVLYNGKQFNIYEEKCNRNTILISPLWQTRFRDFLFASFLDIFNIEYTTVQIVNNRCTVKFNGKTTMKSNVYTINQNLMYIDIICKHLKLDVNLAQYDIEDETKTNRKRGMV